MKIAVLGVGSMRAAPAVLGSLARFDLGEPHEIGLFDPNEERLDLMDRFARECFEALNNGQTLFSSADAEEVLNGATHVIFCLGMDGAVRLLSPDRTDEEEAEEEPSDEVVLTRGDINRPTPRSQMSQSRRRLLSVERKPEEQREKLVQEAAEKLLEQVPDHAACLWLVRDAEPPADAAVETATWPADLTAEERQVRPHKVLRIIQGEESIESILQGVNPMVVHDWLERHRN